MKYLNYSKEHDMELFPSTYTSEAIRPVRSIDCIHCDKLGFCKMTGKQCKEMDGFRHCGLPNEGNIICITSKIQGKRILIDRENKTAIVVSEGGGNGSR